MEKKMKTIKKYWALIVGAILGIFGIVIAAKKKHDNKQADKIDQKIDDNKQQNDIISGKADVIEDQRNAIKHHIKEQEEKIEEIKLSKKSVKPKKSSSTKENILNKTTKKKKQK